MLTAHLHLETKFSAVEVTRLPTKTIKLCLIEKLFYISSVFRFLFELTTIKCNDKFHSSVLLTTF